MACPFFEPRTPVRASNPSPRRVPLIEEYDGFCHAAKPPIAVPELARFRMCNHGNSTGVCSSFPTQESRSALRYEVIEREGDNLRILCIEEQSYAPLRWYPVQYSCSDGQLQPDPEDCCIRAQLLAFCRSYLACFR